MIMKKNSLQWMMAAIFTFGGLITSLTSCSDNDDISGTSSVPSSADQKVAEQLAGNWTMDADGMEDIDLATVDLQINKDRTLQFVAHTYIEESDQYLNVNLNGTWRALPSKVINGTEAQALEITFDEETMRKASEGENFVYDADLAKDTLYYQMEGNSKVKLKVPNYEEDEYLDDIELAKGTTDTATLNKSGAKRFVELCRKYYEQYEANPEAAVEMAAKAHSARSSHAGGTRAGGRTMKKWMKDIPDSRMVCQLMVPGTHDAATFGLTYGWMLTIGKTQMLNWEKQFDSGIRAFDIRSRQFENSTYLFHSMLKCNISFSNALDNFAKILKNNPDEGIILMVKGEGNDMKDFGKFGNKALNELSELLPINFNFDQLNMEKTIKEDLRLIYEKLGKAGLLAKYKPDMTMKDLRGKALIWLVNQPDNWDLNNSAYDNLRDYIALEKGDKVLALDGSSVQRWEQNEYECPENKSQKEFVEDKGGKFEDLLKKTAADPNGVYWCTNAANAYYKEVNFIPNYVTFANMGYPTFINSIKKYDGSRGIILQDYAGQSKLRRMGAKKFLITCLPAAIVNIRSAAAGAVTRKVINTFLRVLGIDTRWETDLGSNALVWAVYEVTLLTVNEEDTHGQELTNAIVESNF